MSRLKESIVTGEVGRFGRVIRDSPDPPAANELVTRAYVDALDGGAEADITALEARVTTAEGDITALDGRVTTAETDITTAEGDITALDGRVTTAEGDITALDGRVTTAETNITGLSTRIALRAVRSGSAQVIPSGAATVVVMNSVSGLGYIRNATAGAGSGNYDLSTGLFTNPGPAQLFLISMTLRCSVAAMGFIRLWIMAPGDLVYDEVNATAPSTVTARVTTVALLAPGTTLTANLFQNTGMNLNLDTNDGFCSLSIFSMADA